MNRIAIAFSLLMTTSLPEDRDGLARCHCCGTTQRTTPPRHTFVHAEACPLVAAFQRLHTGERSQALQQTYDDLTAHAVLSRALARTQRQTRH